MERGAGMASGQKGGVTPMAGTALAAHAGWRPEAIPERVDGVDGVGGGCVPVLADASCNLVMTDASCN